MQAVNVPVAPSAGANSSVLSNVLTKCEIVIHYLQVYGMVLVLDLNIPYPDAFRRWSTWIRLSTLNLEDLWRMDLEYQQEALFAIVMLVPALLLGLYFYCDRLRGRQVRAPARARARGTAGWRLDGLPAEPTTLSADFSRLFRVCLCFLFFFLFWACKNGKLFLLV
jgi:hypothetical protein